MIGQTPINIAALTLNTKLVSLLFSYGAVPTQQNSEGETVFHSLVEYARIRPNKVDDVINMMQHIVAILKDVHKAQKDQDKAAPDGGDKYRANAVQMMRNFL